MQRYSHLRGGRILLAPAPMVPGLQERARELPRVPGRNAI